MDASPGKRGGQLTLRVFGGFSISRNNTPLEGFAYDKVRALLAYLAIEADGAHRRERLADLLWPSTDGDTARNNLRNALFNLRKVLGEDSPLIAQEGRQSLRLAGDHPLSFDFREFNAPPRTTQVDTAALEARLALYRGPVLEGLSLPDAPEFDQWLYQHQEATLRRALLLHQQLAEHYRQSGQPGECGRHLRRQVVLAPWQENHRRQLMQHLADQGDIGEALLEYDAVRNYLEKELGVAPEAATSALAERIRSRIPDRRPTVVAPPREFQQRIPVTVLVCLLHPRQPSHPDEIHEALAEARQRCSAAIGEHGGHYVQLHAGELSAYFGYPTPQERAPRRALNAAMAIAAQLAAGGDAEFSIGLHTGWMLADSSYAVPDVAGEISRRSGRLAALGRPGSITVSREIVAATEGYFKFAEEPAADGSIHARLLGRTSAFDRIEAAREAERTLTPLVGRQRELQTVLAAWADGETARSCLLIHGEAGIGKSRLMQAAAELIVKAGGLRIDLRCQPDYQQTPHFPLSDFVQRRFKIPPDASNEERAAALQRAIARERPELVAFVPALCTLLNLPSQLDQVADVLERRGMLDHALLACIRWLAGRQPLLVTLEDAHWAGPSTLDILTRALAEAGGPRLWLMTSRDRDIVPGATQLALDHFDTARSTELARRVPGAENLAAGQIAGIVERADGMPLYIEQMVRSALDDRCQALPASLGDLLAARLAGLGAERQLAHYAATIGREFDREILACLWDGAAEQLAPGLEKMCAVQLLQQEKAGRYAFRHALIRDAAYLSCPLPLRRRLHARLADIYVERFANRVADHPELLAHHLDAAGRPEAADAWLKSGMHAALRSAQKEAVAHFRRGLEKLAALPAGATRNDLDFRLNIHLGNALIALDGYGSGDAQQAYGRAQALSAGISNDSDLFQLMWGLWLGGRSTTGEVPPLALTEKLRDIAGQSTDPCTPVMLNYAYGNNYFWMGQQTPARRHLEAAIAASAGVDSREMIARYGEDGGVTSRAFLAWVLWIQGHTEQAKAMSEEAVAHGRRIGHAHSLGYALAFAAVLHRHFDLPEEASAYGRELAVLSEKHALLLWQAVAATALGWADAVRGDAAGIATIRLGVAGAQRAMLIVETTFLSFMVDGLHRLGQQEEAEAIVDDCIAKAILREDIYFLGEFHRLKGEIRLARRPDQTAAAQADFETGLRIAEAQGARILALRLATSLARLHARQGRRSAAVALLDDHYRRFAEGLAFPDLQAAARLLAELRGEQTAA